MSKCMQTLLTVTVLRALMALNWSFLPSSQPFARHQDKQTYQHRIKQRDPHQRHKRTLDELRLDERFLDARKGHECVLAEAEEREGGVQDVLVRH